MDLNISSMNSSNTTTETPSQELSNTMAEDFISIMLHMSYIIIPTFLVVGVCGNTMTIVVMRSRSFRGLTTSYILIALAISDTIQNILLPFNKGFVRALLGVDIRSLSDLGCVLYFWAFRVSKMTSSWLIVLISLERLVGVCMPMRASVINTKRNALLGIALIYAVIGAYVAIWASVSDRRLGGICRPNTRPPGLEAVSTGLLMFGASIYALVPSIFLVIFTTTIVVTLHRAQRTRRQLSMSQAASTSRDPTAKTTIMLVAVSIAFVVLVLPVGLAHTITFLIRQSIYESTDIGVVIYREVSQVLEQLNYSINFILYVIVCRSFRERMLGVLFSSCRFKKSNNSSSTSGSTASTAYSISHQVSNKEKIQQGTTPVFQNE